MEKDQLQSPASALNKDISYLLRPGKENWAAAVGINVPRQVMDRWSYSASYIQKTASYVQLSRAYQQRTTVFWLNNSIELVRRPATFQMSSYLFCLQFISCCNPLFFVSISHCTLFLSLFIYLVTFHSLWIICITVKLKTTISKTGVLQQSGLQVIQAVISSNWLN